MLNVLSTAGAEHPRARLPAAGVLLHLLALQGRAARRPIRGAPRASSGTVPSPPPTFNFDEDPIVTEPAYNYKPGREVHVG